MTTQNLLLECLSPRGASADFDALLAFENGLDLDAPERSAQPCRILGYGEISTVFEVQADGLAGLACKRLSIFETQPEYERYAAAYHAYNRHLQAAGLRLPAHGHCTLRNARGRLIFYILQERLPRESFGPRVLRRLEGGERLLFFRRLLQQMLGLWAYNRGLAEFRLGLDGQLSNWALSGEAPGGADPLLYLDTSTPFLRLNGLDQLDPELFLRTAPSFLTWLLRALFLKQVMDRYYDFRLVVVDLIANLHKEGQAALIPELLAAANDFFAHKAAALNLAQVTAAEVNAYYREDARIWSLYLSGRYLDRFIRRRVLRREYPYLLPGRVRR
jgi:hypothetical protein